ncbi:MAG TPA: hypothetical protein VGQ24_15850 [Gemmatimonadales bacterium]|jgi:DNA-binding IclR family transcriptional regulator|nr:hypothetical protein [Gemmatimonadales bacterium]
MTALQDRRLQRRDLYVYGVALEALSYYEPRPLKLHAVSRMAHIDESDASRAIQRLLRLGYLESGPRDGNRRTFLVRAVRIINLAS